MFAILRQASGRRHEVEFDDDAVLLDVAIGETTIQITMTAAEEGDPGEETLRDGRGPSRGVGHRPGCRRQHGQTTRQDGTETCPVDQDLGPTRRAAGLPT